MAPRDVGDRLLDELQKVARQQTKTTSGYGESVVCYEDIYYLEASRDYVAVHTQSK